MDGSIQAIRPQPELDTNADSHLGTVVDDGDAGSAEEVAIVAAADVSTHCQWFP